MNSREERAFTVLYLTLLILAMIFSILIFVSNMHSIITVGSLMFITLLLLSLYIGQKLHYLREGLDLTKHKDTVKAYKILYVVGFSQSLIFTITMIFEILPFLPSVAGFLMSVTIIVAVYRGEKYWTNVFRQSLYNSEPRISPKEKALQMRKSMESLGELKYSNDDPEEALEFYSHLR